MATHIEAKIIEALVGHYDTLSLTEITGGTAYPGASFKPTRAPFVRLQVFKNDPIQNQISFGRDPIRQGLFQASVFWTEGKGIVKPTEVAGKIADHFARGTKITGTGFVVRIDEDSTIGSDIQEKDWVQVPVTIPFIIYP